MDSLNDAEEISDLIVVGELTGYKSSVWKFPDRLNCPLRSCHLTFDTRQLAILHYTESHAPHTALCPICEAPQFLLYGPHHLESHYKRLHPDANPPQKVKEIQPKCPFCERAYKSYYGMHKHQVVCVQRISTTNTTDLSPNANQPPSTLNENAPTMPKSILKKTDKNSEKAGSWEDLDTDHSSFGKKVSDDRRRKKAKRKCADSNVDVRRLVKQKSRLFTPRHRAFTCTICCAKLKNYVIACNHYRSKHGRAISMCTFCKRYFTNSAFFVQHMMNAHPEAWNVIHKMKLLKAQSNAYNKETTLQKSNKQMNGEGDLLALTNGHGASQNSSATDHEQPSNEVTKTHENASHKIVDENEANIVILGENTKYPPMKWHFPRTKNCPKVYCNKYFESRHATMQHYCKMHAKNDLLCEECNTLISMMGQHNLINHFQRKHPNSPIPMPNSSVLPTESVATAPMSADAPNCIDQIDELNEPDNVDPPTIKAKKIDRRRSQNTGKTNSIRFADKSTKLATPEPTVADKSLQLESLPRSNDIFEIDLTQDDSDANLSELNEKNEATKTTAPVRKHANKKKSSKIDASSSVAILKSSLPPTPTPSQQQQQQTSRVLLNKRQRTRSTGVRHKACTICGLTMRNYVDACDHYRRSHGRNVLICPYCELYFLQANLLTKHVLAEHSKEDVGIEVFNEQKMMEMDDAIGFNESHIECGPSISSAPSKSILKNRTRIANDKAASSNGFNTDPIVIDTEPLNLTTTNCNEPLDLSIKNPK